MNLKSIVKLLNQFFDTLMIVLTSHKAIEDLYSTILTIFIVFMMIQNLQDCLEN